MSFVNYKEFLYNKVHSIEIRDGKNFVDKKTVDIVIKKDSDGTLIIKLRDANSFLFNYTAIIHRNDFHLIKNEQSLDIDFDEFETHLVEMLTSNLKKEMLLKCELSTDGSKCRMIFYEKSRIKCLIFLMIEMVLTSQKELFEEMETNMKALRETNNNLIQQLTGVKDQLRHKEKQIIENKSFIMELQQKFIRDMQNINKVFLYSLRHCESLLTEKVLVISGRIVKVMSDMNVVKNESHLKSASSARLLQSMENLRVESLENISVINKLKNDCASYEKANRNLENEVFRLTQSKSEKDRHMADLESKLDEYRKDLENSAILIAKKTEAYNELVQDMEQASQVIRNYNKHYDLKAEEVDELKEVIKSKDNLIKEQIFQNNELFKEFHEYKVQFNPEETDKLLLELSMVKNKLETVEKDKREMVKLNGLLTKKLSSTINLFENGDK